MARERGLNGVLEHIRRIAVPAEMQALADAELMNRYSQIRDESAFTALVRRYGTMVLGVCRRVLGTSHDAEDAFQATFLAFAREINRSGGPKTIGSWLYTVAYNVAHYERKRASKAREREQRQYSLTSSRDPFAEAVHGDIRAVIDEELVHLPEKYRQSLILCDLIGAPHNVAAQEMGLHPRSMTKRLNRARHLLRKRLIARGITTLSMSGLFNILQGDALANPVSPSLVESTVDLVGAAMSGAQIAATACALAQKAHVSYVLANAKTYQLLAAVAVLIGGTIWAIQRLPQAQPERALAMKDGVRADVAPREAQALPRKAGIIDADAEPAELSGRVLDPDGKVVANAHVAAYVRRSFHPGEQGIRDEMIGETQADAAGEFSLALPKNSPAGFQKNLVHLWFAADGHAPATLTLPWHADSPPIEARLLRADPIRGRVVGEDGKPVAGAPVSVYHVGSVRLEPIQGLPDIAAPSLWPKAVTTGEDGSFAFDGLNLKQGVCLRVSDERYALHKIVLSENRWAGKVGILQLAPDHHLEGVVKAADTGKPIPWARLSVLALDAVGGLTDVPSPIDVWCDGARRYRVRLHPGQSYRIEAFAPDGAAYISVHRTVTWLADANHLSLDLALPPGVPIHGRVMDSETGRPVARAQVQFLPDRSKAAQGSLPTYRSARERIDKQRDRWRLPAGGGESCRPLDRARAKRGFRDGGSRFARRRRLSNAANLRQSSDGNRSGRIGKEKCCQRGASPGRPDRRSGGGS